MRSQNSGRRGYLLVLLMVLLLACFDCRDRDPGYDGRGMLVSWVRIFLEDYYWWHKKLPDSFEEIRPLFKDVHEEADLSTKAKVTWQITKDKIRDDENGGYLSGIKIRLVDQGFETTAEDAIDLRDPDKVWTFHHTYIPGYASGAPARTPRNLANGVAMSIAEIHKKSPKLNIGWDDIIKARFSQYGGEGADAVDAGARQVLTYEVTAKEIVIKIKGTTTVFRYPLDGPRSYNSRL